MHHLYIGRYFFYDINYNYLSYNTLPVVCCEQDISLQFVKR